MKISLLQDPLCAFPMEASVRLLRCASTAQPFNWHPPHVESLPALSWPSFFGVFSAAATDHATRAVSLAQSLTIREVMNELVAVKISCTVLS